MANRDAGRERGHSNKNGPEETLHVIHLIEEWYMFK